MPQREFLSCTFFSFGGLASVFTFIVVTAAAPVVTFLGGLTSDTVGCFRAMA